MDVNKQDHITGPPRLRVLILENNPRDAKLMASVLESGGVKAQFEVTNSPEVFRQSLEKSECDVILADFNLRNWTAFDALDVLQGSGKDIPLIVTTGSLGDEPAVECIKRGAADVVLKDRLARLPTAVQRALNERRLRTENLRASEAIARLATIVESSDDAIIGKTLEGVITSWNQGAEKLYGYSAAEVLGKPISLLAPPDRSEEMEQILARLKQGERVEYYESVRVRKDGTLVDVSLSIFPRTDSRGVMTGAASIARDITKRKRAEAALRESQQLFNAFMDNTPAVAFMRDDHGGYVYVNRAFERMAGKPATEVIGKTVSDLWPDSVAGPLADDDQQVLAEDRAFEFAEKTMSPDGSEIDWLAIKFPFRDGKGTRCVGCVSVDVTQARRAEAALRRSEQRFRLITETIDEVFWIANPEVSEIVYVSPAYSRVWGRTQESLYKDPKSFVEACHPDDRQQVLATFGPMKAGKPFDSEYRVIHTDGSIHWVWGRGFPIRDETGILTHYAGIAQDVTARRRLEDQFRQAQKMEAVGRLAGGVAHDFNNLLTIINGYSEMALEHLHSRDPLRSSIEEIMKAGGRAASLTRQLLAFSRQQVLAPRVLDLNALVAEVERMLRRLIGEDIDLVMVPGAELGRVKADPGQIEQILVNLAVNARDAMPEGGKLVIETANVEFDDAYARSHPVVTPGRYVILAMSDSGTGMDAATQGHIFEPFFTTKEHSKGTGLGLSTVYGIVKQSGGYIWVYSELGRGTTFKIYLPLVEEAVESFPGSEAPKLSFGGSETILLVEDEEAVRTLASKILQERGYRVLESVTPEAAFQIAEHHLEPIDLLLTDVVLPGVSGRKIAEHLTLLRPSMKVLYMSGYTDDAVVRTGVLESNTAFLQKPFTPSGLARKVREVLDAGREEMS